MSSAIAMEVRPVGLVHGLGRGRGSMAVLSQRLQRDGFAVFVVDYPSRDVTLAEAREIVGDQVDRAVGRAGRCDLVGHSLGGVIALQLKAGAMADRVGRVVQMGSPNLGSPLADFARAVPGVKDVMGPVLDTIAESDIGLTHLPEDERPNLGCIAGTGGWRRVTAAYGLEGENDGKVSVESALGVPHGASAIVEASHSMLPLSMDVAAHVTAFLRTGRFADSAE
ncbi:MAG: esterase/lipase family protein [Rubricella sp.]